MSANTTLRRPPRKAAENGSPAADTAPANTAAPDNTDAYPGALPPAETTVSVVSEQTGVPADRMAEQVKEVVNTTLQDVISGGQGEAPNPVSAESVHTVQLACYDRAIGRSRTLAAAENRTSVEIGADLQEAIDAFKSLVPKKEWWRQRTGTLEKYDNLHRLRLNGRAGQPYRMLQCYHIHRLASDAAKTAILDGMDGRPFPNATLDTIGEWVDYARADDTYTIKPGYESHFDALILATAENGWTAKEVKKRMAEVTTEVNLGRAAAQGKMALRKESEKQTRKRSAERADALDKAVKTFETALNSDAVGGASGAELLNRLADRGMVPTAGLIDPATVTIAEAMAFADRLCELDRADIIHVMMKRFQAYTTAALANGQASKAPAPALDDSPGVNEN